LDKPPEPLKPKGPKEVYLKIDGTYLKRWGCALVYKHKKDVIFYNFVIRENYHNYCYDLARISESGYKICGVTSDKHGGLISSVKTLLPNIPHQHCLVHLQLSCQKLLTRNPKTETGVELLQIARHLNTITSHYEKNIWLKWLDRWEKRHTDFIKEKTYSKEEKTKTGKPVWWYTHKNLRQAFRTLKTSENNAFLYLDNPNLSKDTNGLEAEFTHLKTKLRIHCGLKRQRRANFVKWYFYFRLMKKRGLKPTRFVH